MDADLQHGIKSNGMPSRTYQRLTTKHDAHGNLSLNMMIQRLRMIEARLGCIDEDWNLFRKIEVKRIWGATLGRTRSVAG